MVGGDVKYQKCLNGKRQLQCQSVVQFLVITLTVQGDCLFSEMYSVCAGEGVRFNARKGWDRSPLIVFRVGVGQGCGTKIRRKEG